MHQKRIQQKALHILSDRTQHSQHGNQHINTWENFDTALAPPGRRSFLTTIEKNQWRERQHTFIWQLDLDLLYPAPLAPLTNNNDPVSSLDLYRHRFKPKVATSQIQHNSRPEKIIQAHWSIRTFPNIDIRDIVCLVTGHSHLMAHTPTIAPNAQERICDVCLTAGMGIHDGTTY